MNQAEYAKMESWEQDYWWHKGKLYLVKTLLNTYFSGGKTLRSIAQEKVRSLNILEIGCGGGEITKYLSTIANVIGFDVSPDAVDFCKTKGLNVIQADINELDISEYKEKFDLILALDVLEHIQDDVETLKRVYAMLKKDGLFFINVPAHKFLWSDHDEALHHKRRYHMYEITKKLKDCGFVIIKKSYFVCAAFPGIAFYKSIWSNLFGRSAYPKTSYIKLPTMLNDFMVNILKIEALAMKYIKLPIGTTIVVVAKKQTAEIPTKIPKS